jgi:2-phospho-L-lactate/phosphoenolpyruvate guanylyltransferase
VRTAAILPVKRFPAAKSRLGGVVGQPSRRELAAAMVRDVMGALAQVRAIEWIVVVTTEPQAAAPARELGAAVIADRHERGQSAAVRAGVAHAVGLGADRVLCVPGDCPALDAAEVEDLLATPSAHDRGVVVVPDRHGTGTNALLLSPPAVIEPSFGPGSFERHRQLAAAAGAGCRVARPPSLLLDVDTGADLQALRERLALDGERAPLTRAALETLAVPVQA